MKQLFTITLLLIISPASFSQKKQKEINPLDTIYQLKNGKANYTEVVIAEGVKKNALYIAAKKWIVNSYKSAKAVIELDDKEAGEIITKGNFDVYSDKIMGMPIVQTVYHVLKIAVKDGKYRYEFTDFKVKDAVSTSSEDLLKNGEPMYHKKTIYKFREAFDKEVKSFAADLKFAMSNANKVEDF